MALNIVEVFGHAPEDKSKEAVRLRRKLECPFLGSTCSKKLSDGLISGVCTVKMAHSGPIVCCPNRLYDRQYRVLHDVAVAAFGEDVSLIHPDELATVAHDGRQVVAFGKRWGKELKLPRRAGRGGYFVDWILALIGADCTLKEFVALEVQSIDTTGSYRAEREALMKGRAYTGASKAGMNWENVSKRILPQIIYKGHVLRREKRCTRGMFFVCPAPVYDRIWQRLGQNMLEYPMLQPGTLTFRWYDIGPPVPSGQRRELEFKNQFTTTIDQVALAFTSPTNLPPPNVYEEAIQAEIATILR